jgi:hypothetical protein
MAGHDERVLPLDLAVRLRDAGLDWMPQPGDRFAIPGRDLDDQVFVLSDMTIEVHERPGGAIIGFNGTTEWALDDLAKEEAVWLPREDQLRDLIGPPFHRLEKVGPEYRVVAVLGGADTTFVARSAEEAYGAAVLHVLGLR